MAVADKLKEHGWYLSEEGLSLLGVNGSVGDIKAFLRSAIDVDLREISCGSFPEDISKGKLESIPGKIVVQIQKIRNISAPKANEESQGAPRMLKLSLSDGQTCCQAVEIEHISAISLNTPPGTKLFLKTDILMAHGILLLRPSCIEVLGGKVPHLVEKWELNRSLAKHTRGRVGEEGGPPPWIPFGEKILRINSQDRNFKSLDNTKDKENRENTEFEAQRKDAIAEAARGGAKKIFGGGNKPLLDHNVQQIVDHGFSVEQAEYALRLFRNSVDRALKSLQKKEDGQRRDGDRERRNEVKIKEERPERRKRGVREEESGAPPKPSGKVTLFDFFEDKLPVQNEKESDTRGFVSNGSAVGGVDRRFMHIEQQMGRGSSNNKSNRTDRAPVHSQHQQQQQQQQQQHQHQHLQQQRRGGSRGGINSGSNRGGRSNQALNSSNTWGGGGDVRTGGSGAVGYMHRDERPERGRHMSGQGSGLGNQTQVLPPQKPPRFQNQQRLQHQQQHQQHQPQGIQQQHQQHHHQHQHQQSHQQPHQQPHQQSHQQHQHQPSQRQQQPQQQPHQLNQDGGYNQQSWLSAYNDAFSNDNWPIGSPANNGKLRDDYVNHGDSYLTSYDNSRNIAPRPGYPPSYDMGLDGQVNRSLGMKMDRLGGSRNFSSQQDALAQKLSSLQVQGGLGRDGFGYSSRPQGPSAQQNQLYNMNYSYKDPSSTPAQPLGSPPGLSSPPGYGGSSGSGGVYNSPSNHFLAEQKPWQWHEGDKCMAKYWEDNMYYNAEVTGVSDRTCVVRFVEYGNFEEVLQDHCIPFIQDELGQTIQSSSAFSSSSDTLSAQNNNQNHFSGVLEFRRGGTRPYVKGVGSSSAGVGGVERRPARAQQQMYVPPAQRK